MVGGLRVESLVGVGRYFITSGRSGDAGRLIAVEDCDEAECPESTIGQCCSDDPRQSLLIESLIRLSRFRSFAQATGQLRRGFGGRSVG
jgi:hypothetical protein